MGHVDHTAVACRHRRWGGHHTTDRGSSSGGGTGPEEIATAEHPLFHRIHHANIAHGIILSLIQGSFKYL
jgi:hypothetical protein